MRIKKQKLINIFFLIGFISFGYSNEKKLLSTDVLPLLEGVVNVTYEIAQNEKSSLSFGGGVLKYSVPNWEFSGTAIEVSYKIFPSKTALKGMYYGPVAGVLSISAKYEYEDVIITENGDVTIEKKTEQASGTFLGIGGYLGYRWIWTNRVALDLYASISYISGELIVSGEKAPFGGETTIGYGVRIGYAW